MHAVAQANEKAAELVGVIVDRVSAPHSSSCSPPSRNDRDWTEPTTGGYTQMFVAETMAHLDLETTKRLAHEQCHQRVAELWPDN